MMIRFCLFASFALLVQFSKGQSSVRVLISGTLIDSNTEIGVANAAIRITSDSDIDFLKETTTDNVGNFEFSVNSGQVYNLSFQTVSHTIEHRTLDLTDDSNILTERYELGTIKLVRKTINLGEVQVNATRSLIRKEIDRITYNVAEDPDSKIESVLDIMKKVPLVSVDGTNQIEIKGSKNFRVMIDGRPSSLFATDPGNALRLMPANTVERIEVITNPPAKYDAEGLAGLLNIITKKRTIDGYNGTLGVSNNFTYGPLASLSTTFKAGKLGVDVFGSFFNQSYKPTAYINTLEYIDDGSKLMQQGKQKYNGISSTLSGQINYEVDTLNLVILSINHKINSFKHFADLTSNFIDQDHQSVESYGLQQIGKPKWNSTEVNLNYEHRFKKHKDQLLTFLYQYSVSDNQTFDQINYDFIQGYSGNDFLQDNDFGLREHNIQVDYIQPIGKSTFEFGGKISHRDNSSYYQRVNTNESDASELVNSFNYDHTIYNTYGSFEFERQDWAFKLGARFDGTRLLETNINDDGKFFWRVLPSLAIQKNINKSSVNFGYNQRLKRPNIVELNPFVNSSNPKVIYTGNTSLEPVIAHNFELSYSNFGEKSLMLSVGYIHTNNDIQRIILIDDSKILKNTYANIGENNVANFSVYFSQQIFNKVRLNFNNILSYETLEGVYLGENLKNSSVRTNSTLGATYQQKKGLRLGLNLNYTSPTLYLQGKSNELTRFSITASKQFFNNRLFLFASLNNPFSRYLDVENKNHGPDYNQYSQSLVLYRSVVLSASFSFGQLKESLKKTKKQIKKEDLNPTEMKILN